MKKLFVIVLLTTISPAAIHAVIPESPILAKAKDKVISLFKDLESISKKDTNISIKSKIRYEFEEHFISNELHCPNEFKSIWRQNSNATVFATDIRPARYIDLFFKIFRDPDYQDCTFKYDLQNSCIIKEPEFKKNESPAKFAQVVIRKVYSRNKAPFAAFNDTLVVGLEEMKIRAWSNNASTHFIGYSGGDVLDVERLKVSAALAYNSKEYEKAYQVYQTIISRYPEEGDPYYRMAIMLYKKDYGGNLNKQYRKKLILEYLNQAIQHGSYSTRHCADNMRYWLTC